MLLSGCGGKEVSSSPKLPQIEQSNKIDPKLAHRFQQRGFSEELLISTSIETEERSDRTEEKSTVISPAIEKMAQDDDWVLVELVILEHTIFNEQTIAYFKEDVYENYPPPRRETIDAIPTVIYEGEKNFILDGLLRNGFTNESFTKEELQSLIFKLVTDHNEEWIVTRLSTIEGLTQVNSGEAVPFRLTIPKEHVRINSFDYRQFGYHAIIEQPKIDDKTMN